MYVEWLNNIKLNTNPEDIKIYEIEKAIKKIRNKYK